MGATSGRLIDCMVFNLVSNNISVISRRSITYPCFPGVLLKVLRTIFIPSHWLLSNKAIVETMDSGETGVNPVAMTIINPRKEYWLGRGSNQRPPVLKSGTLLTEVWGSAR